MDSDEILNLSPSPQVNFHRIILNTSMPLFFSLYNVAWPAAVPRKHETKTSKCLDCETMENVGAGLMQTTMTTMAVQTTVL